MLILCWREKIREISSSPDYCFVSFCPIFVWNQTSIFQKSEKFRGKLPSLHVIQKTNEIFCMISTLRLLRQALGQKLFFFRWFLDDMTRQYAPESFWPLPLRFYNKGQRLKETSQMNSPEFWVLVRFALSLAGYVRRFIMGSSTWHQIWVIRYI